jgi:pimeloyl-ACP methyl ester carboxylesterase
MSTTSTSSITVSTSCGSIPITVTERGAGRPVLLLHGGAGPQSVAAFADLLATTRPARVLTPTHPGFGGTPRPDGLSSIADLAAAYVALLDELDLVDVTVVGNSIGGWAAAEIALLASPRVSAVVLVDAVGLDSDTDPIVDFFSLSMDEVTDLSYYEPERFRLDTDLPEAARRSMAGNRAALLAYGGTTMADPSLLARLPAITHPVLVVWGAADRVVPVSHGIAYTEAITGARYDLIEHAGHLPQLETPQRLVDDIWSFADEQDVRPPTSSRTS